MAQTAPIQWIVFPPYSEYYLDDICASNSPLYIGYRVFPGGKATGAWRWPSTTSSAEVKEKYSYISTLPLDLRRLF